MLFVRQVQFLILKNEIIYLYIIHNYLINPKICHRIVGYLEEEACISYTEFLKMIDDGNHDNIDIPKWTKDYWHLGNNAKLRELVIAIREDEAGHRDVNHKYQDKQ